MGSVGREPPPFRPPPRPPRQAGHPGLQEESRGQKGKDSDAPIGFSVVCNHCVPGTTSSVEAWPRHLRAASTAAKSVSPAPSAARQNKNLFAPQPSRKSFRRSGALTAWNGVRTFNHQGSSAQQKFAAIPQAAHVSASDRRSTLFFEPV